MRKWLVITFLFFGTILSVSFINNTISLRQIYSQSPDKWPKPVVDSGVEWKELGPLPASPLQPHLDSLKHLIELGKTLFFDPRLSGSGKISCATCHQPELSWTDGKERSMGHAGTISKRNAPSIQNSWFYKKLFWDGRARDLEDQAFAPINSESEMGGDMRELPGNLRKIKGYAALFDAAYGDPGIDPYRIARAIAVFEKTIISSESKFDQFLSGNKRALNNSELRGLHLFRTKARCMNCHNGPLFTDNGFHDNGFHQYDKNGFVDSANLDYGLYQVTHKESDMGKFKTPSLRDVMMTGPWMHQGMMKTMGELVRHYDKGTDVRENSSPLLKTLFLTYKEQADLLAFLNAISSPPAEFKKPAIPQ